MEAAPSRLKGVLGVNRLTRTPPCGSCRNRKTLCDGKFPSCSLCQKNGRDCLSQIRDYFVGYGKQKFGGKRVEIKAPSTVSSVSHLGDLNDSGKKQSD